MASNRLRRPGQVELLVGFEPTTSSLPRKCSTPELQQQTRMKELERVKGIEPSQPAWKAGALPLSYTRGWPATGTLASERTQGQASWNGRSVDHPGTHTPLTTRASAEAGSPPQKREEESGRSRIRTCEGRTTRFTVWPRWPLGYPPASGARSVGDLASTDRPPPLYGEAPARAGRPRRRSDVSLCQILS